MTDIPIQRATDFLVTYASNEQREAIAAGRA